MITLDMVFSMAPSIVAVTKDSTLQVFPHSLIIEWELVNPKCIAYPFQMSRANQSSGALGF